MFCVYVDTKNLFVLEEHKNNINWDFLVKTTQTLIGDTLH